MGWAILCCVVFVSYGLLLGLRPRALEGITQARRFYSVGVPLALSMKVTKVFGYLYAIAGILVLLEAIIIE